MNHHHKLIRSLIAQLRLMRAEVAEVNELSALRYELQEQKRRASVDAERRAYQEAEYERQHRYDYHDEVSALNKALERNDSWGIQRARERLKRL